MDNEKFGKYPISVLDEVFSLLVKGDSAGAVARWDTYKLDSVSSAPSGIKAIPLANEEKVDMCDVFLSHDYSDLQNSIEYRRAVAAVFAMCELTGQLYRNNKWWIEFLALKSDEVFRCDELVRTAREYENGREDKRAEGGYRLDVAEIYYLTVWKKWKNTEQHKKMRGAGASTVSLKCRKQSCSCQYKRLTDSSVNDFVLPPYRYGCDAYLTYGGF